MILRLSSSRSVARGRLLDDQPEREVVAARVRPPFSGRKEPRLGLHELERSLRRQVRLVPRSFRYGSISESKSS